MILTGGEGLIGKELRKVVDFKLILDTNITEDPNKNIYKSEAGNIEDFCNMIGVKPKVIYHLTYSKFDINNFGNNLDEFIKVIEYAKKTKAKLIYLSNPSVYNEFTNEDFDENPVSLEGEYYFILDKIAKYYRKDIEIVGFRIFDCEMDKLIKAFKLASKKGNGVYNLKSIKYKKDFGD